MKAKMTKLCLLFILLCSLPVFYSCSDEADAFYLYEYWEVMLDRNLPLVKPVYQSQEVQSWELRVA
ncbi:hypothetical protein NXU97_13935 [Bacteroides xylanisolvens]|nr:hypothetical protein [Bacteroides xylanisolvens]